MSNHKIFDWVTIFLVKAGIPFVDHRLKDGCLWVKYEDIDGELIAELGKCGAQFAYSNKGSKATKRQPAWYLATYPKLSKEPKLPSERKKGQHAFDRKSIAGQTPLATGVERKTSQTTSIPEEQQTAKPKRMDREYPSRPKRTCSNCANMGTAKCGNGGFKVCEDWLLKEKLPEYTPPMRKGGSGWGSPQPEDSWSDIPYSIRNDLGGSGGSSARKPKKKTHKKRKSK